MSGCALHGVERCSLCQPVYMVPYSLCPTCGYTMNAAGVVSGESGRPAAGDITGCMACGERLVFDDAMQMRLMTDAEYAALDGDQQRDLAKIRAFAQTGWYRPVAPPAGQA